MPTSKPRKGAARPVRFVKSSSPGRRAPKRAVAKRAQSRTATVSPRRRSKAADADGLPRWQDLSSTPASRGAHAQAGGLFAAVSTLRLALLIIATAALVTLYVGHVYATSELLAEVDQLRRENLDLHLRHNQVKADFDRASGPATIAARARTLGLVEAVPSGHPINLDLR
ncbi:MAG: hypothetical protein HKN29_13445 [Rhodothermales bacterium]|nr:hypothetical protein [Rhodothermales bacterium]